MAIAGFARTFCVVAAGVFLAACSFDWDVPTGSTGPDAAAPVDCAELANKIVSTREPATSCMPGPGYPCTEAILDTCGCKRYVREITSAETAAYSQAIAAFLNAQCVPNCSGTCPDEEGWCSTMTMHCSP